MAAMAAAVTGPARPGPRRWGHAPFRTRPGAGPRAGPLYSMFASTPEPGKREIPWNRRSTVLREVRRARSQLGRLSGCIPGPVVSE